MADDGAMSSEIFVPVHDDDAMRGFLLQALRANTSAVAQLGEQSAAREGKLDQINVALHSIDKRLAVIENSSLARDVETLRGDFNKLEAEVRVLQGLESERKGAMKTAEWFRRWWPAIVGILGMGALVADRAGLLGG